MITLILFKQNTVHLSKLKILDFVKSNNRASPSELSLLRRSAPTLLLVPEFDHLLPFLLILRSRYAFNQIHTSLTEDWVCLLGEFLGARYPDPLFPRRERDETPHGINDAICFSGSCMNQVDPTSKC